MKGDRRWGPPHGRARYFRRAGVAAFLILALSVWGFASLVRLAAQHFGLTPVSAETAGFILIGVWIAAMSMLLGMGGRRFVRPLRDIMDAADRVAGGDYAARVNECGPPPIRSMAASFNTMTERLQHNDELRRQLMADVSHELRTPLSIMQARIEGLLDGLYPRDDARMEELLEETRVLSRLVEDLRTLALSEAGALELQKETTDLTILITETARAFDGEAAAKKIGIRTHTDSDLPLLEIDPLRIREVLTNLLANALRHTPENGTITVDAAAIADGVAISVSDSGAGISPESLPHIFERFTKGPESHGSGLGLTIARNLVEAHSGRIRAESALGKGTSISFTLPTTADPV